MSGACGSLLCQRSRVEKFERTRAGRRGLVGRQQCCSRCSRDSLRVLRLYGCARLACPSGGWVHLLRAPLKHGSVWLGSRAGVPVASGLGLGGLIGRVLRVGRRGRTAHPLARAIPRFISRHNKSPRPPTQHPTATLRYAHTTSLPPLHHSQLAPFSLSTCPARPA